MSQYNTAISLIDSLISYLTYSVSSDDASEFKELEKVDELIIRKPDDFHLHLRDGDSLPLLVPHTTLQYARAIIMPNLVPPVVTVKDALAYRARVMSHVPKNHAFTPLMTLYLTDSTQVQDIIDAAESGRVFGVKLYPRHATTNSAHGVTDVLKLVPVLEEMAARAIPLLIHGEVTDPAVDVFARESKFLDSILPGIIQAVPQLSIVLEHISTAHAVRLVEQYRREGKTNIAATITCHHLISCRTDIFQKGINPHLYCLPIIKTETDRRALVKAAISGKKYYFAGTDSAPHEKSTKERCCGKAGVYTGYDSLAMYAKVFDDNGALGKGDDRFERFVSSNGAEFYGLQLNKEKIKIVRKPHVVPQEFDYLGGKLVPYKAGEEVPWTVESLE